jgi:RNA polymerase sigma factor (sigma-70 family)
MNLNLFNHIYESHWYRLFKTAKRHLQTQDAEDAVSYTLIKLWENDPYCKDENDLGGWLFKTLKRRILDIKIRNTRRTYLDIEHFDFEYSQKQIELFEIDGEVLRYLLILIKTFTEQEKKIFDLYFLKQLPVGEISRILKTRPQTISNQLVTLRRKLNTRGQAP